MSRKRNVLLVVLTKIVSKSPSVVHTTYWSASPQHISPVPWQLYFWLWQWTLEVTLSHNFAFCAAGCSHDFCLLIQPPKCLFWTFSTMFPRTASSMLSPWWPLLYGFTKHTIDLLGEAKATGISSECKRWPELNKSVALALEPTWKFFVSMFFSDHIRINSLCNFEFGFCCWFCFPFSSLPDVHCSYRRTPKP